jgi:outer membrane protein
MKKIILTVAFIATTGFMSMAQKFAYVDSEYILGQVPDYKTAQGQLDALSLQWQKEVEAKYADIDKMYKAYQAEQVLLSEDMKRKREDDIIAKEKEAKDIQKAHFGVEGDLFKKRQELVKPIQDKIYSAIKELAEKTQLKIIFDKGTELNMIFADAKLDKSDDVLVLMGYKKKSTADKK